MKYIYKIHGSTAIYLDGLFDEVSDEDISTYYPDSIIKPIKFEKPMAVDGDVIESYNEFYTIIHDGTNIIDYVNGYDFSEGRQQIVVPFSKFDETKSKFYKIENKKLKFLESEYNENLKKEIIAKLFSESKEMEEKEKIKPFKFKGYLQLNRSEEDQTSVLKILTVMTQLKQKSFPNWKIYDEQGNEHYIEITVDELMEMGIQMQNQTTKVMRKFSEIREIIKKLSLEQLQSFSWEEFLKKFKME